MKLSRENNLVVHLYSFFILNYKEIKWIGFPDGFLQLAAKRLDFMSKRLNLRRNKINSLIKIRENIKSSDF